MNLISLKQYNDGPLFELGIQQGRYVLSFSFIKDIFFFYETFNRLVVYHSRRNQTKSTTTTYMNIPIEKWIHFTWTYSNKNQQSNLYIDSTRQQSIDFGVMSLDFESK